MSVELGKPGFVSKAPVKAKPPGPWKGKYVAPPVAFPRTLQPQGPKAGKAPALPVAQARNQASYVKDQQNKARTEGLHALIGEGKINPHLLGKKVGMAPGGKQAQKEYEQQYAKEHAKTYQPNFLGIPIGPKESESHIAEQKAGMEHMPHQIGLALPSDLPGVRFAVGGGAAGKVLAHAEIEGSSFPAKLWNSAAKTLASLPAGLIETVKHPANTLKEMAKIYTKPEHAFNENPAGALLAWLAPAAALERGAGAAIRVGSKGKYLDQTRPSLAYDTGITQGREWQPGVVSQLLQKAPDQLMKALGKGEKPIGLPAALNRVPSVVRHKGIPAGMELSPSEVSVKGMMENGRVKFRHIATKRGYVYPEHDFALEPVGGKKIQGKDYSGRPKPFHYDPEVATPTERASTVSGKKETHFTLNPGWHDSGTFKDIVKPQPGVIYRGISHGELEAIKKSGRIKSNQTYNIANEAGTLWSRDPSQAMSYASGFAPNHLKPGFERPGYVIAIREPESAVPNRGMEGERVVPGHVPVGEVIHAYEVRPSSMQEGDIRLRREATDQGYRHGGGGMPSTQYAFREVKTPTNLTPERVSSVSQATKLQERRDILGSRLGGIVRPGQIDEIKGGERLAHNLETMRRHDFLQQHLPHDAAHATAVMTFLEGYAKRPDTFWPDVAERVAILKYRQKDLNPTEMAHNKATVEALEHMEQHRDEFGPKDLRQYADAAHQIALHQVADWHLQNQEGIGEPNQLNARNIQALLTHGKAMDRGELTFNKEPGPHEYVDLLAKAKKETGAALAEVKKIRTEIKGTSKLSPGMRSRREEKLATALERRDKALVQQKAINEKLSTLKYTGQVLPNGDQFPGVYDEAGKRISAADTRGFLNEHFEGRELGFLPQGSEKVLARSQNSYGPRTTFRMRTGNNALNGAYESSPAALRDQFDRVAANLATMRGRRGVVEHLAVLNDQGKPFADQHTATEAAATMNRKPGGEVLQHHLGPWQAYNVGALKVAHLMEGRPFGELLEKHGIVEQRAMNEETGSWVILPKAVGDRLDRWNKTEDQVNSSLLRKMTSPWRQTNLYTSVRWPWGTTQENQIRLAFHQVSPLVATPLGKFGKGASLSFKAGGDIQKGLDEKINDPTAPRIQKDAALKFRAMLGNGSFAGSQIHELEPHLHPLAQDSAYRKITESAPNTKVWRPYRKFVGDSLNKMETNAKVAAAGKLALNDAGFFKKFRQIDREQAAHDYVEKITTDPEQSIGQAKNLLEIMGNWQNLTPYTRQAQAEWAPFVLWWLNSAKFVFKTLPRDHPYALGLLAAMVTGTGAANRNLAEYLTGTVPLDLPLLGKINLNPVHYSPFDIGHEPAKTAASMVTPQLYEPLSQIKGVDALTGDKLTGGEGTGPAKAAVEALGSYVPGVRAASQLVRQGGKQSKSSIFPWEIEPGTSKGIGEAAAKLLLPFMWTPQTAAQAEEEPSKGSGKPVRLFTKPGGKGEKGVRLYKGKPLTPSGGAIKGGV